MSTSIAEMQKQRYLTHPTYKQKFPVHIVREIIRTVIGDKLKGTAYDLNTTDKLTKEIADIVRDRLKALKLPRYKFMVQVEGVRMGCRCFWDNDTVNQASATFTNDSLFCVCTAFGVYLY
eukprot:GSMAST32.ASY1.ANO1.110.1 assembled CDS